MQPLQASPPPPPAKETWIISPGDWAPCSTGFSCNVSVLGTHLYPCSRWRCCERLRLASGNIFWETFNAFARFTMSDLPAHLLAWHWVFSSFWPQIVWLLCLTLPIHLILPPATILCFPDRKKKSSKGNVLLMWRGETKNSRSPKRRQFEQLKKHLSRCTASHGEGRKVTEL